ncbi:MAG TPA: T9SS type A sorting domain-containing protein [Chitinophagaceae bacterium]|nr:T9SS type A sorting domain-containing protein [Chitinophagaceae bacterium]
MRKILLLFLLVISSISFVYSQTPCVLNYQINNGGGSCPDLNGNGATGTITLTFDGPIDPLNIPHIVTVFDITDPANQVEVTDVTYGDGILLNNGDVKFCYYVGPANNNNLAGHNSVFRFLIAYAGDALCVSQGALPVAFGAFSATRSNSLVALKWTTATESNNLGFEIQRLVGNGSWQTLSFVATQAAQGNSASDLTYTYSDLNQTKGISQYRIRQIDIDKRSKFSEIRAVRGDNQKGKTIVYPNPSSDGKVNIIFDETTGLRDISLMDINGRVIKQMKGVTNNNILFENLTAGIYTVRIVNNETSEHEVQKFVVNKR